MWIIDEDICTGEGGKCGGDGFYNVLCIYVSTALRYLELNSQRPLSFISFQLGGGTILFPLPSPLK